MSNCQISQLRELIFQLDELDCHIVDILTPTTTEQEIKKINLRHRIEKSKAKLTDAIEWIDVIKTAYIRGVQD